MTLKKYLEGNLSDLDHKIVRKNIKDSYEKINYAIKLMDAEEYKKAREVLAEIAGDIADVDISINAAMSKKSEE